MWLLHLQEGKTALDHAQDGGYARIVALLQ